MDTTKSEMTTNIVLLTGFQRNGSAMLGISFHDVDHVSNMADIFMSQKGPLVSLRGVDTRWREHILREAFGMNRIPFNVTSTVANIGPVASSLACSKIFNAIADGKVQSDITVSLNSNDKALLCKAAFQHCPGYFPVWDEMLGHERCKVIYVKRENPIALAVSAANAMRQQQWQVRVKNNETAKVATVKLNPRHLLEFCAFYESQTTFFDAYFADRDNVMTVEFLDLITDWDTISQDICEFIGIERQEVKLLTGSQIGEGSHIELIENLGEVYSYFKGSHWEHYFGLES
jgi:LPS sulfotransferase NodH